MRILICAAEQEELNCAIQALRLYESKIAGKAQIDFMLTGIGIASACYRITKKLVEAEAEGRKYSLAINIGIAGSFDLEKLPVGSAALIEKEYFGDLGFMTASGFLTLFDSKTLDSNLFPFKEGALEMLPLSEYFNNIASTYKRATGVTVQTVSGNSQMFTNLVNRYSAQVESMEGAAFFYICLNEHVQCMELRSISNKVGESDVSKWDTPKALEALKEACKEFFRQFTENQHINH